MDKEEIRQCETNGHTCGTQEPYEKEIWAGGVLCAGCGRTRPNVKYVLLSAINTEEQFYKQWMNHHPYKEGGYTKAIDELKKVTSGVWDKANSNEEINEMLGRDDPPYKEEEKEKLVPVWHHPNKGTIPVHKEEVDKPVVIWGEPLRYRKDNFIKESELGDFIDWIRDIDFKKYSEGWCQAGGSNGWHCSTEELLKAYREGFYPNNQSKEEAGEEKK